MPINAIVFDAYGTLFDVYSVDVLADEIFPGHGAQLSGLWRDKQIEYTRLRTLCDQYVDFWQITEDALEFACERLKQTLTGTARKRLLDNYADLTAFPENIEVLEQLKEADIPLAILSNGTQKMLNQAISASGMGGLRDAVLSVDSVRRFKTAPEAYQLGPDHFDCRPGDILFVSSNCWDICGAAWFGYRTIWLNRYRLPLERLGIAPDRIGTSLKDVVEFAAETQTNIPNI
ncbi:haloacid dehalogenase type II [Devosia algicola]|uniref:(S)-2-haloacid dehalogenase n=1 Tax=Devosia algicola TaxID=3026418 RepID=A0ABY7YPE9_9HYPH|nr:haloacid dehalogenase type II [Devosia algicola]WDR03062.1 haloacid dehalogenase type II [Devosia algicola]